MLEEFNFSMSLNLIIAKLIALRYYYIYNGDQFQSVINSSGIIPHCCSN